MNKAHRVTLSVVDLSANQNNEFAAAAEQFLQDLATVSQLDVRIEERPEPGTRGLVAVLTSIVVWGASVGAFKALYTIGTDFYERYHNAEIELKFDDGSSVKLKGLTRAAAERAIEEHFARNS